MFGLLKAKNTCVQDARNAYAVMLGHVREPLFYTKYGVPDTFDGRFDLLVMHASLFVEYMAKQGDAALDLNQALFDVFFADMDQTLRETGVGDTGIPKHMKRMMKGFNGRVQAYEAAVDDAALTEVLTRNLYGTLADVDSKALGEMVGYVLRCRESIAAQKLEALLSGRVVFAKL